MFPSWIISDLIYHHLDCGLSTFIYRLCIVTHRRPVAVESRHNEKQIMVFPLPVLKKRQKSHSNMVADCENCHSNR